MKKISLYFCAILVFALAVTGCKKIIEIPQPSHYYGVIIDNQTESATIIYSSGRSKTVGPGEKITIDYTSVERDATGQFMPVYYTSSTLIGNFPAFGVPPTLEIKNGENDEILPVDVWEMRNWVFSSEENAERRWEGYSPTGEGYFMQRFEKVNEVTLTVTNDFKPHTANFIYKNGCSNYIFIESPPHWVGGMENPGDKTELSLVKFTGFPTPLEWAPMGLERLDSVVIQMGNRRVVQRRWLNDPLYRNETYTLVSEDDYNRTYEFTFTDDFFADGEVVE